MSTLATPLKTVECIYLRVQFYQVIRGDLRILPEAGLTAVRDRPALHVLPQSRPNRSGLPRDKESLHMSPLGDRRDPEWHHDRNASCRYPLFLVCPMGLSC